MTSHKTGNDPNRNVQHGDCSGKSGSTPIPEQIYQIPVRIYSIIQMSGISLVARLLLATLFAAYTGGAFSKDWRKGAEGREVDCELRVHGRTYLKGLCKYEADKDGSFRLFGDRYFVYLNTLDKGFAGVSWNGTTQASHAHELLGEDFKRQGACWVGRQATVCARDRKPAGKTPASLPAERIRFSTGAVSATVSGQQAGFDTERNYVIAVGRGQTLTVESLDKASDGPVSVYLTDPQGEAAQDMDLSCHGQATVRPTRAGDYRIQVLACRKADPWTGSFRLKVTVK